MKLGNKEPAPKPAKAEAWRDPDEAPARDAAWLDSKTEAELADLDEDFDDDRFLESYRRALCLSCDSVVSTALVAICFLAQRRRMCVWLWLGSTSPRAAAFVMLKGCGMHLRTASSSLPAILGYGPPVHMPAVQEAAHG